MLVNDYCSSRDYLSKYSSGGNVPELVGEVSLTRYRLQ